jgi:acetyl esterase
MPCERNFEGEENTMPIDPRVRAFLEQVAAADMPVFDTMEEQRRAADKMVEAMIGQGPSVAKVEDRPLPGPAGQIPARVYTPRGTEPFPVLVYFHGGGFWMGNIHQCDGICRELTDAVGCVVVSVEYRLAPEHKFPAAVEDCYAATRWVAENASALGADPTRVAVGGASAGGNLAAVVTLVARDRGAPPLMYQLLQYPVTNYAFDTLSYLESPEPNILTRDIMIWCWNLYLRTEADGDNPYASPLRAPDLRGLPPALVITAEYDPLRDEGEAYAARLREASVPVVCTRLDGMIHGCVPVPLAEALQNEADGLRLAFARSDSKMQ